MAGTIERHEIADVDEFEDGSRIVTEVRGREIAVFHVDGEFHAIVNYCIHEGGPLCEGPLRGQLSVAEDGWSWAVEKPDRIVSCPWHGWQFDIETGENVDDGSYVVPTYETVVEDGTVYVVM